MPFDGLRYSVWTSSVCVESANQAIPSRAMFHGSGIKEVLTVPVAPFVAPTKEPVCAHLVQLADLF